MLPGMTEPLRPVPDTPDPDVPADDELVRVRYGDLVGLELSIESAREDLREIVHALRLDIDTPLSPTQVVHEHVLPKIAQLMIQHDLVARAEKEVLDRARALGRPIVELENGQRAVLAGQRLTPEQSQGLRRGPRRR